MRNGRLSYEQFRIEAELLQKRSHALASRQKVGDEKCVATWEWRHGNRQHLDGNSYLVSTGNARHYEVTAIKNNVVFHTEVNGERTKLLEMEEMEEISNEETQTTLLPPIHQTTLVEFHIVYHTIYQTPVLYFRASTIDGLPLPSDVVTHDVELPGSTARSTIVAMEEHPVLGKLFSYLHPCETAAAMQLLQAQCQKNDNARESLEMKVPWYLASWLSLVQPLTGISPLEYYAV